MTATLALILVEAKAFREMLREILESAGFRVTGCLTRPVGQAFQPASVEIKLAKLWQAGKPAPR